MLKDRVMSYLDESGCPRAELCRRLDISYHHLYKWLHGERRLSDELENRIKDYLEQHEVRR